MYDSNTILEIYWFWTLSDKFDKDVMMSRLWNYYWKVAVIKMWLNWTQSTDMKNYIDNNLLWINYDLPWVPWTTYCSKLVWTACKYSWKKLIWMMIDESCVCINYLCLIMLEQSNIMITNNIWKRKFILQ